MEVRIISAEDWDALYINGELVSEGHELGDGDRLYLLELSEKCGFTSKDIKIFDVDEVDEEFLFSVGRFPQKLSELQGEY